MPRDAHVLELPGGAASLAAFAPSRAVVAVSAQLASVAAALVYANRTLAGDVYFLLASGRHIAEEGLTGRSPFRTLAEGKVWHNQQWLAEWLFYRVHELGGMSLLSVLYALLLASALVPLAWLCRERAPLLLAAAWAVSLGGLVAVLDPRAAGFSIVLFAAVVGIIVAARRRPVALIALPVVFALWANLHGAFPAGLLLVGLAGAAGALGLGPGSLPRLRARSALPFAGALGVSALALLATPLGPHIVDYLRAYDEHVAPNRLPFEWQASYLHPPVLALVAAFAALAAWLWRNAPRPRRPEALIVAVGFTALALTATRQVVWLGPLSFYLVHSLGPDRTWGPKPSIVVPLGAAGVLLLTGWAALLGPTRPGPPQAAAAARHAMAHPPARGRLLVPSGTGSYVIWRDRHRPITIDGRLELYSAREVIANYRLLNGEGGFAYLRRWRIGGVVTRHPRGARVLQRHGFRVAARRAGAWYLVKGRR